MSGPRNGAKAPRLAVPVHVFTQDLCDVISFFPIRLFSIRSFFHPPLLYFQWIMRTLYEVATLASSPLTMNLGATRQVRVMHHNDSNNPPTIFFMLVISWVHSHGNPVNLNQPVRLWLFHGGTHSGPLSIWSVSHTQSTNESFSFKREMEANILSHGHRYLHPGPAVSRGRRVLQSAHFLPVSVL